jgi:phosphate transport system substrate-binding protein
MTNHREKRAAGLASAIVALLAAGALVPGCKPKTGERGPGGESAKESDGVESLDGAGASFPYPVYSQWAYAYEKQKGVRINYQSIGSGGGIAQIKAGTVDFGASDAPLKAEELEEADLLQFPMIMGGVVPVVNVQGVRAGGLQLTAELLVDIFSGEITKWNDDAVSARNPEIDLPDKDITVVHRADGSGTTWIFTNFLSKVSEQWDEEVGTGKAVEWPTGVGGKGNEGVAQYVQKIDGAIGYVEYAYALNNKIPHVRLENAAGRFVEPTQETFQAAAANADWENAAGFYMVLTNQPGEKSWPITGASFILLRTEQDSRAEARAMLDFFSWCFENGDEAATKLHYVPIPDPVIELVKERWSSGLTAGGEPVWP